MEMEKLHIGIKCIIKGTLIEIEYVTIVVFR
jgi:hypothetical protein